VTRRAVSVNADSRAQQAAQYLHVIAGLTRQSIFFEKALAKMDGCGSSPRMTPGGVTQHGWI
jgi:hypothetical protein